MLMQVVIISHTSNTFFRDLPSNGVVLGGGVVEVVVGTVVVVVVVVDVVGAGVVSGKSNFTKKFNFHTHKKRKTNELPVWPDVGYNRYNVHVRFRTI